MSRAALRLAILGKAKDAATNFVYYDRKEDEECSVDDLQNAVAAGVVTWDEIAAEFRKGLEG